MTFPPSEKAEAVKEKKGKVLRSCHEKRADLKDSLSVNQIGSMNFQRYFFPLDGGGGVLIQSNYSKNKVTSKNSLTDESTALSSALFHKIPSRSSCYACGFLLKLPNKLLAARSAIEFLEMPISLQTNIHIFWGLSLCLQDFSERSYAILMERRLFFERNVYKNTGSQNSRIPPKSRLWALRSFPKDTWPS